MSKNGFTQNIFVNTLLHTYIDLIDCTLKTKNQIPKSCPALKSEKLVLIFIGSKVTAQTRLKPPITL